jgi:hypothetical protein
MPIINTLEQSIKRRGGVAIRAAERPQLVAIAGEETDTHYIIHESCGAGYSDTRTFHTATRPRESFDDSVFCMRP